MAKAKESNIGSLVRELRSMVQGIDDAAKEFYSITAKELNKDILSLLQETRLIIQNPEVEVSDALETFGLIVKEKTALPTIDWKKHVKNISSFQGMLNYPLGSKLRDLATDGTKDDLLAAFQTVIGERSEQLAQARGMQAAAVMGR